MDEGWKTKEDEFTSLCVDPAFQADQDRDPRARQVIEGGEIEGHKGLFLRENRLVETLTVVVGAEIIEPLGVVEANDERFGGFDGGKRKHDSLISEELESCYKASAAVG